jgi:3-oxoisoapionate decarboxylase
VVDNIPFEHIHTEEQDRFAELADKFNVEVEIGIRGIQGDHLEQGVQLAQRVKAKVLRVVVEKDNYLPDEKEIEGKIQEIIPLLRNTGIRLAIENTERFKAKKYADLIESIHNEYVGICLDTANNFGIGEGIETVINALGRYTIDLHLKDYVIKRKNHRMGFTLEGCPAGKGQLDIPWVLGAFQEFGHDPNVVLELWTTPENDLKSTIEKEKRWVTESIVYLCNLLPSF